jgi:hypothetical protein
LHELVDVAVQAIGHRAPLFIRRSTVVHCYMKVGHVLLRP